MIALPPWSNFSSKAIIYISSFKVSIRAFKTDFIFFDFKNIKIDEYKRDEHHLVVGRARKALENGYSEPSVGEAQGWYDKRVGEHPPTFFGRKLVIEGENLDPDERSWSAARIPNEQKFVWGTSAALQIVDNEARIVCTLPIGSAARRLNLTADGRLLVVGHEDGAIRWYLVHSQSAGECLSLILSAYFTDNDDGEWGWLAWRPDGKFAVGGRADVACYPVEYPDGKVTCVDYLTTKDRSYDPEAVARTLVVAREQTGSDPAVTPRSFLEARVGDGLTREVLAEASRLVEIVRLDDKVSTGSSPLDISLKIAQLQAAAWPKYLLLTVEGVGVVTKANGLNYPANQPIVLDNPGTLPISVNVPLESQRGEFQICAHLYSRLKEPNKVDAASRDNTSVSPCWKIKWTGQPTMRAGLAEPKPRKLWALAIGLSDEMAGLTLAHAKDDALDIARFLERDFTAPDGGLRGAFAALHIDLVVHPSDDRCAQTNSEKLSKLCFFERFVDPALVTVHRKPAMKYKEKILQALRDIVNRLKSDSDHEHVVFLYFSGHGFTRQGKQYLAMPDGQVPEPIDQLNLQEVFATLKDEGADSVIILDACRADPAQANLQPFATALAANDKISP